MNDQSLARGLAFFSVGLGLAELLAPRQLARFVGIDEKHETLLRLLGLRELSSGIGMLQGDPRTFLWSRVAGDAMDLALLEAARRSPNSNSDRVGFAIAAVAGVTVLDIITSVAHETGIDPEWRVRGPEDYESGIEHEPAPTIPAQAEKPRADVATAAASGPATRSVEP